MKRLYQITPIDCLIILALFHLIGNLIWIKFNIAPPAWDQADHARRAIQFTQFFQDYFHGNLNIQEFWNSYTSPYGPFVKFITGFIMLMFGPSVQLSQIVASVFFILMIISTYLLGNQLFKNQWIGLLSAFILSFYQLLFDNSRWFLLDIPMSFFILMSIYFLLKSEYFQKKKELIFAFIFLAFAMLTKLQALIYFLFPFLYVALHVVKEKKWERFKPVVLMGVLLGVIVSLWVLPSMENILRYSKIASTAEPGDLVNLADPATWLFYLKVFIDNQITFYIFIFFVISLIFFIKSKTNPFKWFVLLNIVIIYIWFTIFPNKDLRFLYPILPFTAMIIGKGIYDLGLSHRKLALVIVMSFIIYNVVQYPILSYGGPLKNNTVWYTVLPYIGDITFFNLTESPVRKLGREKWPNDLIIQDLYTMSEGNIIRVDLIPNYDHFNENNLLLGLQVHRYKNILIYRADGKNEFRSNEELNAYISQFDYFIYTPNDVGVPYQIDKKAFEQIQIKVAGMINSGEARILSTYWLPTGEKIEIVAKKTPGSSDPGVSYY